MGTAAATMAKHSTQSDEALPTEGGSQLESSKRRKLAYCGAAKYNTITVSSRASGLIVIQSNLCGMISTLSFVFPAITNRLWTSRPKGCYVRITVQQTHTRLLRTVTSQPSVSKLFQESFTSEDVIKAEVLVTNFLVQHNLQQLIIWAPYSKPFSRIAKLPRDMHAGEQRQLPSSLLAAELAEDWFQGLSKG